MEKRSVGLWQLAKWAWNQKQVYNQEVISTLNLGNNQTVNTSGEKAEIFHKQFFPQPPEADLSDMTETPGH